MKRIKGFIICLFFVVRAGAQTDYHISKTNENIILDGYLTEKTWREAEVKGNFIQHYPYDTSLAETQTFFQLAYDDGRLYAAFTCINRNPNKAFVV